MIKPLLAAVAALALVACAKPEAEVTRAPAAPTSLYPGETPEMRRLVQRYAQMHGIPEALLHRVIQRESNYRPSARNGPYWGLMQVLPQTARQMGFQGRPEDLLNPEVNLTYAGRYLRGAWLVSGGDIDRAVMWYARGYYFEARDRCMLVATGLNTREIRRDCPSVRAPSQT
ncbi:MAG: transglycosylase SLT domain-containing protein [Roseinatronobacter sp.]|jgi:soluble lytic murein transglycosylase-like protein|nr:transglycosylase SLT domain-containing protein [Roseinatronobacter sp.]